VACLCGISTASLHLQHYESTDQLVKKVTLSVDMLVLAYHVKAGEVSTPEGAGGGDQESSLSFRWNYPDQV
jgi:hypothetical protein